MKNIIILALGLSLLISCTKTTPHEFILYDFESESVLDDIHWKCHTLYSLSNLHAVHGKKSLKLEMFPSSYPGLSPSLKYHDWEGYKSFCFEVYNPLSENISLVLRVDDKKQAQEYSERYNKSFTIVPGPNSVRIPFNTLKTSKTGRPLELENIDRFLVFMSHPDKKHVLYLDYFRLLKH
ncbi:MAG: hypothetical protein PF690_00565 [Deltaproteobacteria bacterium]|nr:hypothetical protein [Deltaproteobacteria bacterium]